MAMPAVATPNNITELFGRLGDEMRGCPRTSKDLDDRMFGVNASLAKADKDFGTGEYIYPEQNLFIWALLMNRIEMAKIFWQIGEVIYFVLLLNRDFII